MLLASLTWRTNSMAFPASVMSLFAVACSCRRISTSCLPAWPPVWVHSKWPLRWMDRPCLECTPPRSLTCLAGKAGREEGAIKGPCVSIGGLLEMMTCFIWPYGQSWKLPQHVHLGLHHVTACTKELWGVQHSSTSCMSQLQSTHQTCVYVHICVNRWCVCMHAGHRATPGQCRGCPVHSLPAASYAAGAKVAMVS